MPLVDNIQERFTARLVYGDVVERDGLIVIPAIRVMGGGGGGSAPEDGDGAGFGLHAKPAGAWVFKNGSVRWKPAIDVNAIILGGQIVGIAYFVATWLIRRSNAKG
ncbi:MAG: sporulation protein [Acidimicrobiia bacterium]